MPYFHVSSTRNRDSILRHGLDWTRMTDAPGIAGSRAPETAGCFLADDLDEADWFVGMNNTGGPVDVWQVDGVAADELVEFHNGFRYLPRPVPAASVSLVRTDCRPRRACRQSSSESV